ncbi:SRPBCC domain-containing protein [Arthrobacter sp.]|uniref:SRPBCC family protein n=1 Tax=Arthrobacter sp. TaxID=1667 RepID=UPI0028997280|nr:SRPBCC domain-containing protein [Arthrobacter sp.]
MAQPAERGSGRGTYLHMVRDFAAEPAVVYDAWADLAHASDWWGPEGFTVPADRVSVDDREGGIYEACMINTGTGEELWWGGTLERLDPPDHLSMTQQWKEPDGTPASNLTLITVDLEPHDGGTQMTFRQGPFPGTEDRDGHEIGWNQSFNRLSKFLARHE